MFFDKAEIFVRSGKGGDGGVYFRREKYVPCGGPDGGDGGRGGDVIFEADENYRTLMDFRYKTKYNAQNGENGKTKSKFGPDGKPTIIKVPVGTLIIDAETDLLMVDLVEHNQRFVIAKGGKGGKGNPHFKSSVRQAPNFAESGGLPIERTLKLELKLIADIGVIGFPNVGKSTLLSVVSSARPKVGNYHFTTITPNLGVVKVYEKNFIMADIPGLIEGAHLGAGLGLSFLKHIERNKMLLHVVDIAGSEGRDPIDDFDKINDELKSYSEKLLNKKQIVAANKSDLLMDEEKYNEFKEYVESKGYEVYPISAATRQGVDELMKKIAEELDNIPKDEEPMFEEMYDFETEEMNLDYRDVDVWLEGNVYYAEGKQLIKIFNSTNFNDLESLRYLDNYLKARGAIDKLVELGIKDGDTLSINGSEFDFYL